MKEFAGVKTEKEMPDVLRYTEDLRIMRSPEAKKQIEAAENILPLLEVVDNEEGLVLPLVA